MREVEGGERVGGGRHDEGPNLVLGDHAVGVVGVDGFHDSNTVADGRVMGGRGEGLGWEGGARQEGGRIREYGCCRGEAMRRPDTVSRGGARRRPDNHTLHPQL